MTGSSNEMANGPDRASAGESEPTPAYLLERVYEQLRRAAGRYFDDEQVAHTLQPTALVHEAFLKLAALDGVAWQSERQFYVLAARAMRNILIDHARTKKRQKRGGGWRRVQIEGMEQPDHSGVDILALDDALTKLASLDPRKARLVELRFFAGMPLDEAAAALEISRSTASEDWRMARAWLHRQIEERDR